MGRLIFFLCLLSSPWGIQSNAQTEIDNCLPTPIQGNFVYDIADLLSVEEEQALQVDLRAFTDSTSNVIVVVTHPDFCEYEPSVFAIEAGDRLGVGRSDLDNGVIIAIKPRQGNQSGKIFIAIGEGLEGAIPDILTGRIVDMMIPSFKNSNWSGGINIGIDKLMGLASGEYSEDDFLGDDGIPIAVLPFVILIFFLFFIMPIAVIYLSVKNQMKKGNIPFNVALALVLANMNKKSNSYNNFSSGRGGFGGGSFSSGSSSFGGFGGGSFGGGGAGGSF